MIASLVCCCLVNTCHRAHESRKNMLKGMIENHAQGCKHVLTDGGGLRPTHTYTDNTWAVSDLISARDGGRANQHNHSPVTMLALTVLLLQPKKRLCLPRLSAQCYPYNTDTSVLPANYHMSLSAITCPSN